MYNCDALTGCARWDGLGRLREVARSRFSLHAILATQLQEFLQIP